MEEIKHSHVAVRELKLHVAEIGTGPKVVLFLHGFPEIWYTWRHQMVGVAKAGYRAVAFDVRGYGLSDPPAEPEKANMRDIIDDAVALLDCLGIAKAFLVGKDFGAFPAYAISTLHLERVSGVVTLGVSFRMPSSLSRDGRFQRLPDGLYLTRWLEPGRAETDFGRFDVKTVVKKIYILFSRPEIPIARDDQEVMDIVDPSTPLPPWFTEEDLSVYASLYEKSGFRTALYLPYRCSKDDCGMADPKIMAPALLIIGEKDYGMKFSGSMEYARSGAAKQFLPNLETVFLPEGCHFVHEQFPEKVNQLIIDFLNKHGA